MLGLALLGLSFVDGRLVEAVRAARSLELNHRVIEALEHGPVILEVTVTNRSEKTVVVASPGAFTRLVLKTPPKAWNLQERIPCAGVRGLQKLSLVPGQVHKERITLHVEFVSDFSAGTYQIGLSWPLTWDNPFHVLHLPEKRIQITIAPATPANRWALLARLQSDFAALPPPADGDGRFFGHDDDPDPFSDLCERVACTPHKELAPLAMKLLDRCPHREWGSTVESELMLTVFFADPAWAHRIFVDRVIARSPRTHLTDVFDMWDLPRTALSAIVEGYLNRVTNSGLWLEARMWQHLAPIEPLKELLLCARRTTPLILPDSELQRLKAAKDFWVRGWIYATFSDRLGTKWCDGFLDEARKWARSAPGPTTAELTYHESSLLIRLRYGPSSTHKLLEILAAGNQNNSVCKEARKLLTELQEKPIKR
jgi:hypothetical protein